MARQRELQEMKRRNKEELGRKKLERERERRARMAKAAAVREKEREKAREAQKERQKARELKEKKMKKDIAAKQLKEWLDTAPEGDVYAMDVNCIILASWLGDMQSTTNLAVSQAVGHQGQYV